VAIVDLDLFKAVNDRYGHEAGDSLLTAFGTLLTRRLRKSDVACRYGGEEFCVLMPRTDVRGATRKIAALLKLWRSARFDFGDGKKLEGLSFSAGVSDSDIAGDSLAQFIRAADEALLTAKDAGRNRVLAAGATVAQPA
jgi:two-component system, cell cycle response regulator